MKAISLYLYSRKSTCNRVSGSCCGSTHYERTMCSICTTPWKYRFSQNQYYIIGESRV